MTACLLPGPVGASQSLDDAAASELFVYTGSRISIDAGNGFDPSSETHTAWVWRNGRRIFSLTNRGLEAGSSGFTTIHAYDADTGREVDRRVLTGRAIWKGGGKELASSGQPHTMTLDESGGRLFAVRRGSGLSVQAVAPYVATLLNSDGCTALIVTDIPCAAGLYVLDAETLETLHDVPFGLVKADGTTLHVVPRAITYAEPGNGGEAGKVLVLVEDLAFEATTSPADTLRALRPRSMGGPRHYLLQIDPDTGHRDWVVSVDGCRGVREPNGFDTDYSNRPHPAAVFRTEHAGRGEIWVGCHMDPARTGGAVRIPLDEHGAPLSALSTPDASTEPAPPDSPGNPLDGVPITYQGQETYPGPQAVIEMLADPAGGRLVMRSLAPEGGEYWTVFDASEREYVGRIGTGPGTVADAAAAIDPRTGRLYAAYARGFFVADVRGDPLAQAAAYPREGPNRPVGTPAMGAFPLVVDSGEGSRPTRVMLADRIGNDLVYDVYEDRTPALPQVVEDTEHRTLDLEEQDGVTTVSLDGAARGYGVRAVLLGGVDAMLRNGPVDGGLARAGLRHGIDTATGTAHVGTALPWDGCTAESREIVVGFVGPDEPAVMDNGGARGGAVPVRVDGRTRDDGAAPVSRCTSLDWSQVWGTALFGRPPVDEPRPPWPFGDEVAQCLSGEEEPAAAVGDPVLGPFSAQVRCEDSEVSGHSYARGATAGELRIGEVLVSFRVYRDPGRGMVSRVESVVRNVNIGGWLRVDTVRATAESWANGRRQPVPASEQDPGYDPNCDFERSAGTCYQRHTFGVWTPGWSCGPCGDEQAFVDGVTRVFGGQVRIRMRQPDPALARGGENGYIAAIQKQDAERFADLVLNADTLQTVVPALEVIRYASPNRPFVQPEEQPENDSFRWLGYGGGPGRQVYQFAGVEVSSSYGIQCLLVYDDATNTCAAAQEPPASLTLTLTDLDGKPLAGGSFEVRADADGDGVLGLVDELVPEGACVTAEDGVGTCSFTTLAPGTYLVAQVGAPPGYTPTPDPFPVELVSGEARTVTFANASGISTINVKAADEAGEPLTGAAFAVYPDPDADGKVAADGQPADTCETTADGTCSMTVPAGSYVLVQTAAPAGLESIEPVAFVISSGGQVATVDVVNYPPFAPDAPAAPAGPVVTYQPPAAALPPTLRSVPLPTTGIPEDTLAAPPVTEPGPTLGGTVERLVRGPGDALRLLARSPAQGLAFSAAVLLFALAAAAIQRRRRLLDLTSGNIP